MLTRGAWNGVSAGIALRTGAHQGDLGARLALGVNSVLVLTRRAVNKASHELALCTGAQQGSLGTRLAQGLYTPHWCSPGQPGMRLAQGLYSVLVLTRAAWERGLHWACTPYWHSPFSFGEPRTPFVSVA